MKRARPPLRGRSGEWDVVRHAVERTAQGRGGVLLIEGGAGFGKTRLLDEAGVLAERAGVRVVRGGGDPAAQLQPLGALERALSGLPEVAPGVGLGEFGAELGVLHWAMLRVEARLEESSAERALVVCLDDLQWADGATIEALRLLPSQTASLPVLWVGAYRGTEAPERLLTTVRDLCDEGAREVHLEPLDQSSALRLAGDVSGSLTGGELAWLVEHSGGVPFFIVDGLTDRLSGAGADVRAAAQAAAALGRSLRFDDLAAMLGAVSPRVLPLVEELLRRGVLLQDSGFLTFRHDLSREAVLAGIPEVARPALMRRAAQVLLAAGVRPLEVVTRIGVDAALGDEQAISTLMDAARTLARSDPGTAGDLLRQALALIPRGDARRGELVAQAAVLLHAGGNGARARDFADRALRDELPPAAEAAVRLSIAQLYSMPADLRVATGLAALDLRGVPEETRARHLCVLVLSLTAASKVAEAVDAARLAERAADATGDVVARLHLAFGRLALAEAQFDYAAMPAQLRAVRDCAAESGDDTIVRAADWFRSSLLAHLDRFDEAMSVAEQGLQAAARDQQAWIAPRWEIWRGWILQQRGRLVDAAAALEGAFSSEGLDLALALPDATGLAALGSIAIHTGDRRLARKTQQIARATLSVGADDDATRQLLWMLARFRFAAGEAVEARRLLGTPALPVLSREVGAEVMLVRLALSGGDESLADDGAAAAIERARRNPDVPSIVGAATHARALLTGDLGEFAAAADQLSEGERPMLLASALEDLGVAQAVAGRRDDAVGTLTRAAAILGRAEAGWDRHRVAGRLRRLGANPSDQPRSGWAALSASEARVARLVSAGRTNREVAVELHVSPHTVNTFVRRAFDKLGIHSRVELAGIVAQLD